MTRREPSIKTGASRSTDPRAAVRELAAAIHDPGAALVVVFASPEYDIEVLGAELASAFGDAPIMGCTTAGEISPLGYLQGSLAGLSLGGDDFRAVMARIDNLSDFQLATGDRTALEALARLREKGAAPSGSTCFGFLLADGLSTREEGLVASLHRSLGDIPLCGGSAGDGTRFGRTFVYHEGRFRTDAAVFALIESAAPFTVFKTEHFVPSSDKMVVTAADPSRRIVTEINGEPAGREYARAVGLEIDKLTPLAFAAHPVVVRVGGATYVRSIQKVNDDESLTFFCAIDEGIVLTVARGVDLVHDLEEAFAAVRRKLGPPALVLGCDCVLRRVECGQRDLLDRVGKIMVDNNVIGLATYGEQYNAMHVNQTFTGVAIGARGAHA